MDGERSLEAGRVHAYVLDARRRAVNGGTRRLESCNGRRGGVWWIESITGGGRRRDRGDCLAHEIRARAGPERVCCLAFGVPSLLTTFTASYADPCPYPDSRAAPLCAPGPPAPNGERLSSSLGTTTAPCRCTSSLSSMPSSAPSPPRLLRGLRLPHCQPVRHPPWRASPSSSPARPRTSTTRRAAGCGRRPLGGPRGDVAIVMVGRGRCSGRTGRTRGRASLRI